jgi:hypothetical protein
MTPKEKAKELVYKFDDTMEFSTPQRFAKKCALIAVDEVIEQNNIWINQTGKGTNNYWKLVKEEINNDLSKNKSDKLIDIINTDGTENILNKLKL